MNHPTISLLWTITPRRRALGLAVLLAVVAAPAHSQQNCGAVFEEARTLTTLEDLALDEPEIEAKFLIPNPQAYESLKSMVGRRIELIGADGRPVLYAVEMNKEHIYEDTNYDTKGLALFQKRGMLRQRVRYDKKPGKEKYKFSKAVFQAKNGPSDNKGLDEAVYARNEVRGTEFKDLDRFEDKRKKLLKGKIDDAAVAYARRYSESDQKFHPVLEIKDERFFMKLTPQGEATERAPWFYISLDRVHYRGLVGRKGEAERLELEAEMGDDVVSDAPAASTAKLAIMDALSAYLGRQFGLRASPESKYESGVRLTILGD